MKLLKLLPIGLAIALSACGHKNVVSGPEQPANAVPIAHNMYCGDKLILTLGAVFKVDVTGGIEMLMDGTYTRPVPFCRYVVANGVVVGG